MLGRNIMIESGGTLGHDALDLSRFGFWGEFIKFHGFLDRPVQSIAIIGFENKTVA
jgi:hypothetical protein